MPRFFIFSVDRCGVGRRRFFSFPFPKILFIHIFLYSKGRRREKEKEERIFNLVSSPVHCCSGTVHKRREKEDETAQLRTRPLRTQKNNCAFECRRTKNIRGKGLDGGGRLHLENTILLLLLFAIPPPSPYQTYFSRRRSAPPFPPFPSTKASTNGILLSPSRKRLSFVSFLLLSPSSFLPNPGFFYVTLRVITVLLIRAQTCILWPRAFSEWTIWEPD